MLRTLLLLVVVTACAACGSPSPAASPVAPSRADLGALFRTALIEETTDPLNHEAYLGAVERALAQPEDPWALPTISAALDALVWRRVNDVGSSVHHAVVHRSTNALVQVTARLRQAYEGGAGLPLGRAFVAIALHKLALRVGAEKAAAQWRARSGCVPAAAVTGPLAWPPLGALDENSPLPARGPLPATLPGVPPFADQVTFEKVYADACAIDVNESSSLTGLRVVAVDIDNPRSQRLYVAFQSSSAARVELGGELLVERPLASSHLSTMVLGSARVEQGRVRLSARVAYNHDGNEVAIVVVDERGEPLATHAPAAGDEAAAKVSDVTPLDPIPELERSSDLPLAVAALLADGHSRRASALFDGSVAAKPGEATLAEDLMRIRALYGARDVPRNQMLTRVQSAAKRVLEQCEDCWEARIAAAAIAQDRKGYGTGLYAAFELLGITAADRGWTTTLTPVELAYVAKGAHGGGLTDIARAAYDGLAARTPGSLMLADLDWALHRRMGVDQLQAACAGGTSRSSGRCMRALLGRSDLRGGLAEMDRLRRLRGSPSIHRTVEIQQLLSHGRTDDALAIYDALSPGQRSVAILGALYGSAQQPAARDRFDRDRLRARDAPWAYEPLARLLGVVDDRAIELERVGARLVARDRDQAFLPGAATAVLRRVERYQLTAAGLLHFWVYDLRRVSGTQDVASGTWSGSPRIRGRSNGRVLRRRIYKQDGRVIDPDPTAGGAQGATDLSQLEAGDYVEAIRTGWALPDDGGQLVVDTPDVLPRRTSVRDGLIVFERPAKLPLSLWAHSLLGDGVTRTKGDQKVTEWRLTEQPPRRIETGVPPLEARVGISFGTNTWQHIARALGDRFRSLAESDPSMKQWVAETLGQEPLPKPKQVARVVAAVGKVLRQTDGYMLSDAAASFGGGPQRETARRMIERGTGSRTWVVHRAMRELGLASKIAVSETRPFSAAPNFPPHTGRFTHPLVVVEVDGESMWIDADVAGPPLPPGRVSPELRGRQALLASGELLTVEAKTDLDVDELSIELSLDDKGDATGSFTALIHGRPAQRLAQAFETAVGSKRQKLLRNVVLGWLPWADVRKVSLLSDEGAWQLKLEADVTIVGFARPEGRDGTIWSLPGIAVVHRVYPGPRATTLGARYASQADRTTALAIDEPLLYHLKRRIELPPKTTLSHLAKPLDVAGAQLTADRTVHHQGGVITEAFRVNLPVGTVAVEAFGDFVKDVRRVDDGFMYGTRVKRGGR
ncbi:MAG: hypothetical protein JRI68_00500 [Deltaproteobacteria bacterium]|nr:hypothetical protein [Deltaproteobacteria bacterium]